MSQPAGNDNVALPPDQAAVEPPRVLSPAAERALAEARARREKLDAERASPATATGQVEHGGRQGPDPVRYGDWENGGIASDF